MPTPYNDEFYRLQRERADEQERDLKAQVLASFYEAAENEEIEIAN
jgi:hypothetical protein